MTEAISWRTYFVAHFTPLHSLPPPPLLYSTLFSSVPQPDQLRVSAIHRCHSFSVQLYDRRDPKTLTGREYVDVPLFAHTQDGAGRSPLHCAAAAAVAVDTLLAAGAKVNLAVHLPPSYFLPSYFLLSYFEIPIFTFPPHPHISFISASCFVTFHFSPLLLLFHAFFFLPLSLASFSCKCCHTLSFPVLKARVGIIR